MMSTSRLAIFLLLQYFFSSAAMFSSRISGNLLSEKSSNWKSKIIELRWKQVQISASRPLFEGLQKDERSAHVWSFSQKIQSILHFFLNFANFLNLCEGKILREYSRGKKKLEQFSRKRFFTGFENPVLISLLRSSGEKGGNFKSR